MNIKRVKLLEEYIEQEPNNPFNHYALAMEYFDNDPKQALDVMEKLINQHKDYLPTYYQLATLYWEMEQLEKAKLTFEQGIRLAKKQQQQKILGELTSAYQNLLYELE